jgi:1,2-diacylglycerol 3-beta-glucosyltransferase
MTYAAWAITVFNALVLAYCWGLALVAFLPAKRRHPAHHSATHRFAIVVPAHNEETTIRGALESLARLDYPTDLRTVFVIADNCTDGTAEVARAAGAVCLERHDTDRRGKGHALGWAFEQILTMDLDALVVLDADCWMEQNALRAFDEALRTGERVLQCSYAVGNPDDGAMSYASAVGNVIENDLFYAPKSVLGLAVFLRGTGMVFHREILERFPWTAQSITEDVQYALNLIQNGEPIKFLADVRVFSPFPVTSSQLMIQRRRWAAGTAEVGKADAFKLLATGPMQRSILLLDAGWTLLVLSRPMIIVSMILALGLALLNWWTVPEGGARALLTVATGEIVALGLYFQLGIVRLGVNRRRLSCLIRTPLVVGQLIWASVQGILQQDRKTWLRTPRDTEPPAKVLP